MHFNEIKHKLTKVARPQTNGFVERFHHTVLDEFFCLVFRTKFYKTVEPLKSDLDAWMIEYNTQRAQKGYCNRGKRPMDAVHEYIQKLSVSPATGSEKAGGQPVSRAESDASLDTSEHRATFPEAAEDTSAQKDG